MTKRRHRCVTHPFYTSILVLIGLVVSACTESQAPPNVLFVSLDTTRRDHLSLYGYERDTSPALDRLGARGAVFENATAQMTITNPSHASMLTGLYPHSHQVGTNTRRLAEEWKTLTEMLSEAGYATGGFVSGHPLRAEITGIDQGFDHYDSELIRRRAGRDTTDRAVAWLAGRDPKQPFFAFVHFYDAHGPYRVSDEYLELFRSDERGEVLEFIPKYQRIRDENGDLLRRRNDFVDRYDALLRYQDDLLAELIEAVDQENTLVVVLADHGETFFERGTPLNLNHGTSVFEEQIAIPLVIAGPGVGSGRYLSLAETVDLMPTLLDLLGLAEEGWPAMDGRNLAPQIGLDADGLDADASDQTTGTAFASNRARTKDHHHRGMSLRNREFIHSVRDGSWKLIRYPGAERDYVELYDLSSDPDELNNVFEQHSGVAQRLLSSLSAWTQELEGDDGAVTEEDREALEALGYVEG